MNKQEQIEQKVTQELGYVSALFMTQECKGTEIVMPTKELKEVAYAISLYFSSLIHQAIAEERERMRGILSAENYKLEEWYSSSERPDTLTHFEANQRNMKTRNEIKDLLSLLDKLSVTY